jgi:hypothetical protein
MVKGSESKEKIIAKILEVFPGAFRYDRELRIPMMEDGAEVQIKVTLTAAKTNVERDSDIDIPGAQVESVQFADAPTVNTVIEPSEEEKQNVAELVARLGL